MTTHIDASEIRPGYQLPPVEKTVYQRALAERAFLEDSIHNDDYTKGQGYPGALVSAYVLAGYVSEPLVNLFGRSWFTTGEFAIRFIVHGVQQGDRVTIGGEVREIQQGDDGGPRRVLLDVWMEKEGGIRPVIGTASAVLEGAA